MFDLLLSISVQQITLEYFFTGSNLDLMIVSIESRFDENNAQVLQGLGYLHICRFGDPETWKKISVACKWYLKDLKIDAL